MILTHLWILFDMLHLLSALEWLLLLSILPHETFMAVNYAQPPPFPPNNNNPKCIQFWLGRCIECRGLCCCFPVAVATEWKLRFTMFYYRGRIRKILNQKSIDRMILKKKVDVDVCLRIDLNFLQKIAKIDRDVECNLFLPKFELEIRLKWKEISFHPKID